MVKNFPKVSRRLQDWLTWKNSCLNIIENNELPNEMDLKGNGNHYDGIHDGNDHDGNDHDGNVKATNEAANQDIENSISSLYLDENLLPASIIMRIAKGALGDGASIGKEAKEALIRSCTGTLNNPKSS